MPVEKGSRRAQACVNCRSQKLACRAGPDVEDTACERCHRLERECVPHVPKPYPERKPHAKARKNDTSEEQSSALNNGPSPRGYNGEHTTTWKEISSGPEPPRWRDENGLSFGEYFYKRLNCERDDRHLPTFNQLSWQKSELLVCKYRDMSRMWPFVIVPEAVGSPPLSKTKPFVLLAIFVVTSAFDIDFQRASFQLFRQTLATKVIVNGERSLELLQGLLIVLAFHHHYLRRDTQQIYQWLQLAIGMVIELGLLDPKSAGPGTTRLSTEEASEVGLFRDAGQPIDHDGKRALLGCYYLSCGYCVLGFNRPQNLAYSELMLRCAGDLAQANTHSDFSFPRMVELCRALENTRLLLDTKHVAHLDVLEQCAARELDALRDKSKSISSNNAWLESTYFFAYVHLTECRISAERQIREPRNIGHTSKLLAAIERIDKFLEFVVERRLNDLQNLAVVEWVQLIAGVNSMCRAVAELQRIYYPDPEDPTKQPCIQIYTTAALNYVDILQKNMSNPNNASRHLYYFKWFISISDKMVQRISTDPLRKRPFTQLNQSMYEVTSDLTAGIAAYGSSSTAAEKAAESGPEIQQSGHTTDELADINFTQDIWPFVPWFGNHTIYS